MLKNQAHRDTLFDIIRGLCALEIIGFWHMFDYISLNKPEIGRFVTIGVLASFTFMSSYFLGQKHITDKKKFYIRRIKRFYIPFAISLSALFIVKFIPTLTIYLLSLLGLSGFFPPMPRTLWYLDMLIIFYILTPFLAKNTDGEIQYLRIISCFLLFIILSLFCGSDNRIAIYFPFYAAGLSIGPKIVKFSVIYKTQLIISSVFILTLTYFSLARIDNQIIFILYHYIMGFTGILTVIIIADYLNKNVGRHILNLFRILSYASMMAYMFHREIYGALIKIPLFQECFPMWFVPIAIVIVFTCAYYMQKLYDSILNLYKNR